MYLIEQCAVRNIFIQYFVFKHMRRKADFNSMFLINILYLFLWFYSPLAALSCFFNSDISISSDVTVHTAS